MDQKEAKINQILVSSPEKPKSVIHAFNLCPSKIIANKFGKIFGFIEIESYHPSGQRLAEFIAQEINQAYYRENSELLEEFGLISEYFEAILKKLNMAIASFIESEHVKIDIDKINAVIALSHQNEIHFSYVGKIGALLFYNLKKENFRIINILDSTKAVYGKTDPLKIFSHITSGSLRSKDVMILCSTNLFDYFSLERVKTIILNPTLAQGLLNLKEMLSEIGSQEQFAVLTMEMQSLAVPTSKNISPVNNQAIETIRISTHDSIHEMVKTEKETEKLLTPSILPEVKKWGRSLIELLKNYSQKLKITRPNSQYQSYKVIIKKPRVNSSSFANQQYNFLKSIIGRVPTTKLANYFNFINKIPRPKIPEQLRKNLFFQSTPKTKITVAVICLLIAAFGLSIFGQKMSHKKAMELELVKESIQQAKIMKDEAQASLIYRDENLARQTLNEAKNNLATVKTSNKELIEEINNLINDINSQLYSLGYWIEIDNPELIIDMSELEESMLTSPTIINIGDNIYLKNAVSSLVAKISIDTKGYSVLQSDLNVGDIQNAVKIANGALVINQEQNLFRLNGQTDNFQQVSLTKPAGEILNIAIFNNRLYTATKEQVFRHNLIGQNYGTGTNWVTDPSFSADTINSLAIDGFIYLLLDDGTITKLLNGRISDFKQNQLDPPIVSAKKLKTFDNSDFLYFLDPPTKRLVVLNKQGKLVNQYRSEIFDNLKDFLVDEQRKEIFILNGNQLFTFPLQHLN